MIHVTELTQPQGHSTSGNHERYKSPERLAWEREYDCLVKMREWILEAGFASEHDLDAIESSERDHAVEARDRAWQAYRAPIEEERRRAVSLIRTIEKRAAAKDRIAHQRQSLEEHDMPLRRDIMAAVAEVLLAARDEPPTRTAALRKWKDAEDEANRRRYGSDLYSESAESALAAPVVPMRYPGAPDMLKGFEIINRCFDAAFERIPNLIAVGEDVGLLGGVNQGWRTSRRNTGRIACRTRAFAKPPSSGRRSAWPFAVCGRLRRFSTWTTSCTRCRSFRTIWPRCAGAPRGGQKAPVIIRTRGHRLEGIWHAGSPMSGIVDLLQGLYVCVPRNSVQAAGFYNTLFQSDDAALVIEVLNGYWKREPVPVNIGEYTLPLGVPEVIRPGGDVTLVTYGAVLRHRPGCGTVAGAGRHRSGDRRRTHLAAVRWSGRDSGVVEEDQSDRVHGRRRPGRSNRIHDARGA